LIASFDFWIASFEFCVVSNQDGAEPAALLKTGVGKNSSRKINPSAR
jgi:hypothetical protein